MSWQSTHDERRTAEVDAERLAQTRDFCRRFLAGGVARFVQGATAHAISIASLRSSSRMRSGLVERSTTGASTSSSMRRMYFTAAAGRSA